MTKAKDRRTFERIKAKFILRFSNCKNSTKGEAETVDISADGIGFITKENYLAPNASLEMYLVIPDYHEPLYIKGEVVWSNKLGDTSQQRGGVRLEKEELMGIAQALWKKDST